MKSNLKSKLKSNLKIKSKANSTQSFIKIINQHNQFTFSVESLGPSQLSGWRARLRQYKPQGNSIQFDLITLPSFNLPRIFPPPPPKTRRPQRIQMLLDGSLKLISSEDKRIITESYPSICNGCYGDGSKILPFWRRLCGPTDGGGFFCLSVGLQSWEKHQDWFWLPPKHLSKLFYWMSERTNKTKLIRPCTTS